jgi:hypothetical protein
MGAGSTARFAGVFFSAAGLREVTVVIFHFCIGSTVAELAGEGWMAGCGPGGLFFDDTFVLVTILIFGHCSIGMMC